MSKTLRALRARTRANREAVRRAEEEALAKMTPQQRQVYQMNQ